MTRYILLFDYYGLFGGGSPLWRENGAVLCICCWSLPAQSFSGPSPLGLETVFYCLRFETSLFVASYDSQGHGGGIRPCLHTGNSVKSSQFSLYSRGTDHIENRVLLLMGHHVAQHGPIRRKVFTEPLPGNALIKSVIIYLQSTMSRTLVRSHSESAHAFANLPLLHTISPLRNCHSFTNITSFYILQSQITVLL
jgi:hypothetical protein